MLLCLIIIALIDGGHINEQIAAMESDIKTQVLRFCSCHDLIDYAVFD